jgi:1,4-dihydroxy-2-naphthoate octaprenyltransferase
VRLVASGLASPSAVKRAAFAVFGIAALVGLALAAATTWWLLAVGVACIAAAWGYTGGPSPYGYLGLGEVFVFVFFGLVATVGTTYVAVERVTALAAVAGCGVGCFACALLVVNNLRDIPTDTAAGKHTLAVRLGDPRTRNLFVWLVVSAFAVTGVAAIWRLPALVAVLAVPIAAEPVKAVVDRASGPALIAVLGRTSRAQLFYGALFGLGLALGG